MIRYLADLFRVANQPCRDQTRLISQSLDAPLTPGEAAGLRLHLLMCRGCHRFRAQLLKLLGLLRSLRGDLEQGGGMPAEIRSRIRGRLR